MYTNNYGNTYNNDNNSSDKSGRYYSGYERFESLCMRYAKLSGSSFAEASKQIILPDVLTPTIVHKHLLIAEEPPVLLQAQRNK